MTTTSNDIYAAAAAAGISEQQAAELAKFFTERGTWTTNVVSVVTHEDGSRHWASQNCERCAA